MTEDESEGLELDFDKVAVTADHLISRIDERFPGRGLAQIAREVKARVLALQSDRLLLKRPMWKVRSISYIIIISFLALLALATFEGSVSFQVKSHDFSDLLGIFTTSLECLFFLGAAGLFIMTLELRIKRKKALAAIQRLRGVAHIIDMHQLTKDPERFLMAGPDTENSPERTLTPFLMGRYLDYSSELLSILSKTSAGYAVNEGDPVLLAAVDQMESLTSSLQRKIWQKMVLISKDRAPDFK